MNRHKRSVPLPPVEPPEPPLPRMGYELEEVAEMLHCGRTTIYQLVKDWQIKTFSVGRKRLISPWELERVIREHEAVEPAA